MEHSSTTEWLSYRITLLEERVESLVRNSVLPRNADQKPREWDLALDAGGHIAHNLHHSRVDKLVRVREVIE